MNFEQEKLNVFREISNIGSGNASTSLAQMLNEIVEIGRASCRERVSSPV